MAKESNTWTWLKAARSYKGLHMVRVENSAGSGAPDVEGCLDGVHFQIELKAGARPKRKTSIVRTAPVRESQVEWFRRRVRAGARTCWVLVQVGSGAKRAFYLLPGWFVEDLAEGWDESTMYMHSVHDDSGIKADPLQMVRQACKPFTYSALRP